MEEEEDVAENGGEEKKKGKCPYNKGKGHSGQDGSLASIFFSKGLDTVKKARECLVDGMSLGGELGFVDGFESEGVDNLTRA